MVAYLLEIKKNPILISDKGFEIREINSKEAACHYGANTDWCTARRDGSFYDSTYSKRHGDLYIITKNGRNHSEFFIDPSNAKIAWKDVDNVDIDSQNSGVYGKVMNFISELRKKVLGNAFEFRGKPFPFKEQGNMYVFTNIDVSGKSLLSLTELPWVSTI
jgi:hypothetical protein